MATHSGVLAWRIPGTGEPGGLPSLGLHRVGHDWSDLAAVAAGEEKQTNRATNLAPPLSRKTDFREDSGLRSPLSNLKQRFLPGDLWQATTGLDFNWAVEKLKQRVKRRESLWFLPTGWWGWGPWLSLRDLGSVLWALPPAWHAHLRPRARPPVPRSASSVQPGPLAPWYSFPAQCS